MLDLLEGAVTVAVPAGALGDEIELTVESTTDVPEGTNAIPGTVFDFGPDGTRFDEPIEITIDAPNRTLELHLDEDEISRRLASWTPPAPHYERGALAKYAHLVSSASE
ncbi:MAG: dihydroxy-acid dehydratase, partial [Gemmatimonadetes bacterium]|nr:dihydroxy-acid dehydratase [Gemmatimonadota bacterium]